MTAVTRRLTLLAAAVVATVSFGLAEVAWACSCIRFSSAAEQFERSEAVFRGRVLRTQRTGRYQSVTTFEVVEGLKGRLGGRVRVFHGTETGGACGVIFRRGQVVAVTANLMQDGRWSTSSCSMPQFEWQEFRRVARGR